MDSYLAPGQEQLKLWISEYGLPTNLVSETAQKDFITDFINFWQTVAGAGPIFLYTTRDTAGGPVRISTTMRHTSGCSTRTGHRNPSLSSSKS